MAGIGDTTMDAVAYALQGTARRAEVLGQNIANVNTPNYRARSVDFESTLADALRDGDVDRLRGGPQVQFSGGLPGRNGNDVSLEDEMVGMLKNNLVQDAMVQSWNFKVNVLRSAIGGR